MENPRRSSKQSGNTLIGIVLGLIIGLAIAIVVALYITRSPTPFVSKNAPTLPSDAATGGQAGDLNRALQGKSPSQPVMPQAKQPPAPASDQGSLQIIEVPPAQPETDASAAPEHPSQPASPTAKQIPRPATAAPGTPPDAAHNTNIGYFLQVGAYKTAQDAEQQRARLALQGFESKVSQRDSGGVIYYRVRIGPFEAFDEMNSARQQLADAGIDTAIIRFQKP